jgi:porin
MRRVLLVILALLPVLPAKAQVLNYQDVFESPTLTGDWGGVRGSLEQRGIQLGGDEIIETLGNTSGGRRQGAETEGRLELFANVDLERLVGWQGALLHANAYQIHGEGLSSHELGNLLTVSNIEAQPATRLFRLWIQQSLLEDRLSVRIGQIAADDEFFVSQYATLFLNATFGWPAILGINLPDGGPAYPAARPGLRARYAMSPQLAVTAAMFSGDPRVDETGLDLRFGDGVFVLGELAYTGKLFALPNSMKLGAWVHSARFADQRLDDMRRSLADPLSSGVPLDHPGDYGGYLVMDQLLWRNSGTSDTGLGGFLRIGANPADRNLIGLHMDAGLTYGGAFGRDNDTIGIGASYEDVSDQARALADDRRRFSGLPSPAADFETAVELSYQTQLASWWIVQPDLQWIIHPGARLAPPEKPDALVLGLRMAVAL